jgi:hypothetical protein
LLLASLAHVAPAHADEPPLVMLELSHCDELEETEVRRIVAAELGARAANIAGQDVTQITVRCEGTRVAIHVEDPLSRKAVQRSFDIGLSDPRARARLVAIAATELVLASWVELETNRHPHVEPTGAEASPAAKKAAREIAKDLLTEAYEPKIRNWYETETPKNRMLRLVPLFSARSFFDYKGTLWGGGVRIGEERFRFLSWAADVLLESGTIQGTDTDYQVTTGTLGATLFAYAHSGYLTGRIGAGLRTGFAGSTPLRGGGPGGTSSLVPWGWPLGAASVTLLLARGFGLDLSGEGGYVVLPARGGGATLSGFWVSGQIGITIVLAGPPSNEALVEGGEE